MCPNREIEPDGIFTLNGVDTETRCPGNNGVGNKITAISILIGSYSHFTDCPFNLKSNESMYPNSSFAPNRSVVSPPAYCCFPSAVLPFR